MYQIDVASAAAQLPAPAAAGAAGFFTDGDPVGGVAATVLDADFMNMLMMELMNIVSTAGPAPSKADHTQVLTALMKLLGIDFLVQPNGYILHHATGFMLQWGSGSQPDASGSTTVAFPQPFSTLCLAAVACNAGTGPPSAFHGRQIIDRTQMKVFSASSSGAAAGAGTAFAWIAVGK